jgi:hypothetical protein
MYLSVIEGRIPDLSIIFCNFFGAFTGPSLLHVFGDFDLSVLQQLLLSSYSFSE